MKSVFHECTPERRKIAVKVVDIFGNDTMTIVDVSVGKLMPLLVAELRRKMKEFRDREYTGAADTSRSLLNEVKTGRN